MLYCEPTLSYKIINYIKKKIKHVNNQKQLTIAMLSKLQVNNDEKKYNIKKYLKNYLNLFENN